MRPANQTRERPFAGLSMEQQPVPTFRGHILLVEDDAVLSRLEAGILTAYGYVVTLVESGELALDSLREIVPDLVLLDLDLPGAMDGWDVLKALRADTGTSAIPVILTSAEATVQKQLRMTGESRSTLDHLPKPYLIPTLLQRIERMLTWHPGV